VTVVYLRFAFNAASFFALGKNKQGIHFIKDGAERLRRALIFSRGKDSLLERTYAQERSGWDIFYETLSVVEEAINNKDDFALDLQKTARDIINSCAISSERSD